MGDACFDSKPGRAALAQSHGTQDLHVLRSEMLRRRRALGPEDAARAALQISRRLWQLPFMARCRRLACYLAVRREADCGNVMAEAMARSRAVFLPVLHRRQLAFAPYRPGSAMVSNRFGIPEPAEAGGHWCRGAEIDVALLPLVAFDERGRRLGMGGGYYDRTFRFLLHHEHWRRPRLVGIAYDFQRVDALPARAWDVPLDAVVTDQRVYDCHAVR